jgi:hypothetical protein
LTVSIRIAAVASLSSLALVAASNISAFAAPNPNNHGHHYGQLKHQRVTPPPVPTPKPTANPIVRPTTSAAPVSQTPRTGNGGAAPVEQPVSTQPNSIVSPVAPVIRIEPAAVSAGQFEWLLLLILPSLIAVWLIALVGLARRLSDARRRVLQVQTAPA